MGNGAYYCFLRTSKVASRAVKVLKEPVSFGLQCWPPTSYRLNNPQKTFWEILLSIYILQARLQQYLNRELPDVQAGFRKGRRTRDQIANICWIIKKAREFQKNIYFCFIDYAEAFDCVAHNKLLKILKETGIPDHPTCLLRNLYAGQEAIVRTGHGMNNRLVPNRKRSMSRLYIVTLLI